jgi:hypothetical protein
LDFIERFRLSFLFDQLHQLLYLILGQFREIVLLVILQFLDVLNLLGKQEDGEANNFLVDSFLDRNAAVFLESDGRDVLQGFDAGRIDVVEEVGEVNFFFVSVESKQYFDLFIGLREVIFIKKHENTSSGDGSITPRDIVEQRQRMEISPSSQCFSIGLQSIFLSFQN